MASYSATPIANTDALNDSSGSEDPQLQREAITTGEKEAAATDSKFASLDSEPNTALTESTSHHATTLEDDDEERRSVVDEHDFGDQGSPVPSDYDDEALSTAYCGTDDSTGVAGQFTPSDIGQEPINSAAHTEDGFYGNANSSFSHTAIGEAQSHTQTHQTISPHTSQFLDDYFIDGDAICNFTESLVEDWANLEDLASQEELYQLLETNTETSQFDVTDDQNGSPVPEDPELYYGHGHQPATYSSGSQQYGELCQEEDLQRGAYSPGSQQHPERYYQNHQPETSSPASQRNGELYDDKTDLQHASYIPASQQYPQCYQEQSPRRAVNGHQLQTYSESYQQQTFQQDAFIPGDQQFNQGHNKEDSINIADDDDDDATVDEEEPEVPALKIDERIEGLKRHIALAQARIQATLAKVTENEKRIQEIGATLKQKRKRADKPDESEEVPAKKTKTPAYRRPSTRKEPKPKVAKGTRRPRTAETPIEIIQYVPEAQVQNVYPLNTTGNAQGLGIQFDQSEPQVQNAYPPNVPSYAQHAGHQFSQSAPATTRVQNANPPSAPSYAQAQGVQAQDIGTLLTQLGHQQFPSGNYGHHASQALDSNGYPQFPFGDPATGTLRWNGY